MNILLINQYAGSLKHGMEYRPYYLSREWVRMGHRVTIVAASYSHVRTRPPRISGSCTSEKIDGIDYFWLTTPSYSGNGARRAVNMFWFVYQVYRFRQQIIQGCKPDIVIASSTHPLDIYPARRIATQAGARLVFEVHDLWPLSPIELGGISRYHPYILLLQRAENYAYRNADRVVCMLPKAEAHMREHGLSDGKFVYIPNGIDVDGWKQGGKPLPEEHAQAIRQLHQQGRFLVGYAGAHGLANALSSLVDAGSLLQDEPVAFVLVGQGSEKANLQKMVSERGMTNVVFLPPVLKAAVPALLNEMDALYIGLKSESLFRFGVSPNKLLDYMMSAKPVLHSIEAGNDLVLESGCGVSVPAEDPAAIADAVRRLMQMTPGERKEMGLKGKAYVVQNHDYQYLARKFLDCV
ncbi:MAG: glycosyltransferase family 4 protein [Chloroflexi bacterium]|nr:glycosyltransferase family 4 protein [Chloroflexota bacterium]